MFDMLDFVRESNLIEGILREPYKKEVNAHEVLLNKRKLYVENFIDFVSIIQPDAVLRDRVDLNVYVGNYVAPSGGPIIVDMLRNVLADAGDPWQTHCYYETLHPFTDGNGRSGRALWLWLMSKAHPDRKFPAPIGFLHEFYYQTLERQQTPRR